MTRAVPALLSCVVAAAPAALLRCQTAPAPASETAIGALLAELDACFARGDLTDYLGAFRPDHPGAHAVLARHLERLFAADPRPRRQSTIVAPPRRVGPRTVVRVRHELTTPTCSFREDVMMALACTGDGGLVPTFAVEVPAQWGLDRGDRFQCPPCNLVVGGADGWLCVPMRPERAQALEAVSFYRIGTDLACDVSVQAESDEVAPAAVVRDLGAALAALDDTARPGPVEPWLPPAHAADRPPGLAAARLEIALPADHGDGGGVARFHAIVFGGMQHLLLLRGSRKALDDHREAVSTLLASYRVLETDRDRAQAAARAFGHHTGGALEGVRYTNDRFGFVLDGPDGWRAEQRCGGAALRVVWSSPEGSRLWLTGYRVPPGIGHWQPASADRWLEQLLERAGLVAALDEPSAQWATHDGCGGSSRRLRCRPANAAAAAAARMRTLHVFLHDALLLVADAQAAHDADAAAMTAAIDSLRRH